MEMTKTSKKKARLAALGLIVSLGLVVALVSIGRSQGHEKVVGLRVGQTSHAAPAAGNVFILPDGQVPPVDASAPALPQVHAQEKDGPLSRALTREIRPSLPTSFELKVASDIADFNAVVLQFEGPGGKVVVNAQTLPRPVTAASVVNLSMVPDSGPSLTPGSAPSLAPGATPNAAPTYEKRQDGSVIVGLAEASGAVVGVAKPDGTFFRVESLGDLGAPPPLQVAELRTIALRHLGLS